MPARATATNSMPSWPSELTVARAAGVDKAFAALLARQADYLIIGLYPGRDEARKLGIADKVEFAAQGAGVGRDVCRLLQEIEMRRAASRASPAGIKTAVDDGAVRRLLDEANKAQAQ